MTEERIADCLERVAEDHSGTFTDEDAEVVAAAIIALRTRPDTLPVTDEGLAAELAQLAKREYDHQPTLLNVLSARWPRGMTGYDWDDKEAFGRIHAILLLVPRILAAISIPRPDHRLELADRCEAQALKAIEDALIVPWKGVEQSAVAWFACAAALRARAAAPSTPILPPQGGESHEHG